MLASYSLDRIQIHDVAVTQDSQRMLCVGVLLASGDGLKPKKSRAEKQILGENFVVTLLYAIDPVVQCITSTRRRLKSMWKIDLNWWYLTEVY